MSKFLFSLEAITALACTLLALRVCGILYCNCSAGQSNLLKADRPSGFDLPRLNYLGTSDRVRLTIYPVAVLRGDANVKGVVTFEQSSESSPTTITYDITGNDPNAERGIHVHAFGDNTNGCTSAGPHCSSLISTTFLPLRFSND